MASSSINYGPMHQVLFDYGNRISEEKKKEINDFWSAIPTPPPGDNDNALFSIIDNMSPLPELLLAPCPRTREISQNNHETLKNPKIDQLSIKVPTQDSNLTEKKNQQAKVTVSDKPPSCIPVKCQLDAAKTKTKAERTKKNNKKDESIEDKISRLFGSSPSKINRREQIARKKNKKPESLEDKLERLFGSSTKTSNGEQIVKKKGKKELLKEKIKRLFG